MLLCAAPSAATLPTLLRKLLLRVAAPASPGCKAGGGGCAAPPACRLVGSSGDAEGRDVEGREVDGRERGVCPLGVVVPPVCACDTSSSVTRVAGPGVLPAGTLLVGGSCLEAAGPVPAGCSGNEIERDDSCMWRGDSCLRGHVP